MNGDQVLGDLTVICAPESIIQIRLIFIGSTSAAHLFDIEKKLL